MSQFTKEDPILVETLLNSLYVDDVNAGASSVEAGYEFYLKAKPKFVESWVTRVARRDFKWITVDKFDDKIIFDISKICEKISNVLTKRSLIQFVPSIFDLLRLLNPVIVKLKSCFKIFAVKNLSGILFCHSVIYQHWYQYYIVNGLREVQKVQGFCNVSERSYGCSVYLFY